MAINQKTLEQAQKNALKMAKQQMKAERIRDKNFKKTVDRAVAAMDVKIRAEQKILKDPTKSLEEKWEYMSPAQQDKVLQNERRKLVNNKSIPFKERAQYMRPNEIKNSLIADARSAKSINDLHEVKTIAAKYGVTLSPSDLGVSSGRDLKSLKPGKALDKWALKTQANLRKLGVDVSIENIKTSEFRSEFKDPNALRDLNKIMGKESRTALETDKRSAKFLIDRLEKTGAEFAVLGYGKVRAAQIGINPSVLADLEKRRKAGRTEISDEAFISLIESEYKKEYQRRKENYDRTKANSLRGFGGGQLLEALNPDTKSFNEILDVKEFMNKRIADTNDIMGMKSILIQAVSKKVYGQLSQDLSARARIERELRSATDAEVKALYFAWENGEFATAAEDYSSSGDMNTNVAQANDYEYILKVKGSNPEGEYFVSENLERHDPENHNGKKGITRG